MIWEPEWVVGLLVGLWVGFLLGYWAARIREDELGGEVVTELRLGCLGEPPIVEKEVDGFSYTPVNCSVPVDRASLYSRLIWVADPDEDEVEDESGE